MATEKPLVSVVIPCYNHGKFIDEAVDSVLNQTYGNIEIIIVNDGSKDEFTNKILKNYSKPKTTVLTTKNFGLPGARNNGIKKANGKYILPLDADDKIHHDYIRKAVKIIEQDDNIGIVYGKTELFGDLHGEWNLPKFSFPEILIQNSIVATSLFRRKDWETIGGYNKNMIYGFEDHDFWLSILELGREVKPIAEVMFYYRRIVSERNRPHSVDNITGSAEKVLHTFETLVDNHKKLYSDNINAVVQMLKKFEIERDQATLMVKHKEEAIKQLHDINYDLKVKLGVKMRQKPSISSRIKKKFFKR